MTDQIAKEEQLLTEARAEGLGASVRLFARLSGPGWLQSAITLGGGSLASALYLGVLSGFHMLWLQVVAMLLGIVMLAAIGYVTLSTGQRPFGAIREHVNPVLGWGWIIAVLLANVVWCLPQFALGTAAIQQNLAPALEGTAGKVISCSLILGVSTVVIWFYGRDARGLRIFEWLLKAMVGLVVLCFFGVVATLAASPEGLPWGEILSGLVPDLSLLNTPSPEFAEYIRASNLGPWWSERIVSQQQDVMIAAAATAVGINMTFLLPYSMLRKGWGRAHRRLAVFDLGTGLLIPFALATGCVVIAAGSRFHARPEASLISDAGVAMQNPAFLSTLDERLEAELDGAAYEALSVRSDVIEGLDDEGKQARVGAALERLPLADRQLAGMLLKRDASSLAVALEPLTGRTVAQYVFGIGVLGMAISTVIILMLISGFTLCEIRGVEPVGRAFRGGALLAGIVGFFGPFIWVGRAKFWLAVPTSNFGMVLLPIAYWTFFFMMNSRSLLGEQRPRGRSRLIWNSLMLFSASVATFASLATLDKNLGVWGYAFMAAFLAAALVAHRMRARG